MSGAVAFTKPQLRALKLLGNQGGARYGTQYAAMRELKRLGLVGAHDTAKRGPGRWTWRPTKAGWDAIRSLEAIKEMKK